MGENESNVIIYIVILVTLLFVVVGGGYGYYLTSVTHNVPVVKASEPNHTANATPKPVAEKKVETIKCELCHIHPEKINQHVNGGKYCINCHGSQVHKIHIGEGTVGLDCRTCHGFPPSIPTVKKGEGPGHYVVCEKCHAAPPNSLEPSNGNLIVIHLSRGKYCTNCHGTDIGKIHKAALENLKNQNKSLSEKP